APAATPLAADVLAVSSRVLVAFSCFFLASTTSPGSSVASWAPAWDGSAVKEAEVARIRHKLPAMVGGRMTRPRAGRQWHVTAKEVSPHCLRVWFAHIGAPRPTCSRVTTADGRSPGLRIAILRRLPGKACSQWHDDGGLSAYSCGGSCGFG